MAGIKSKMSLQDQQLHQAAQEAAQLYQRSEIALIEILQKVDASKLFYKLGCNSLFAYSTQALGLSSEVASIYIRVARKSQDIPQLKNEIKSGALTVSKAKTICSVITKENQNSWIGLAKTGTSAIIEKSVALANPKLSIQEKMNYIHPNLEEKEAVKVKRLESTEVTTRVQLTVGVSEKLMLKIRRAQDILSQKLRRPVSIEETISAMTESYLFKFDPVEKAKRFTIRGEKASISAVQNRSNKLSNSVSNESELASNSRQIKCSQTFAKADEADLKMANPQSSVLVTYNNKNAIVDKQQNQLGQLVETGGSEQGNSRSTAEEKSLVLRPVRKPIPQSAKHQLISKFNGQCGFTSANGARCSEKRFLEIHHITPVSKGGSNDLKNLTLICSGHHKSLHSQEETRT